MDEFEIVDGLTHVRAGHEDTLEAETVRVRSTPETEAAGYAGLVGVVMGETMPSASGVAPILGARDEDYAINVWFDEIGDQVWFAPGVLEPA